jgi:hypothetical protein
MDFRTFFEALDLEQQESFAAEAGYSRATIALHFACDAWRRRTPSGTGFARIVAACRSYDKAPKQAALFSYFYEPDRKPRRRATDRVAA